MSVWKYAPLLGVMLMGCQEATGPEFATGAVLLEIEYINYAWTPTFFGYYLDAAGNVYAYDRNGTPWPPGGKPAFTQDELEEKFARGRILHATRDSAEVAEVTSRIVQIDPARVTAEKQECADAGLLTYRAYQYDPDTRTYQPVLLRAEGDVAQENTSPAAQALIDYIRSLDLLEELLGCDPGVDPKPAEK